MLPEDTVNHGHGHDWSTLVMTTDAATVTKNSTSKVGALHTKSDKKNGEFTTFYDNGDVKCVLTYVMGKLNGPAIHYYKKQKGQLKQ